MIQQGPHPGGREAGSVSEGCLPDRQLGAQPMASALICPALAGACDFESWASGFDSTTKDGPSALPLEP